jgi:large subunit ribosomal protein L25
MEIPVKLNGLAEGVKAGGKLVLNVRKLKVKGLYTNFPDTLDIDVTSLGLGKSMKVATLSYDNIEIITSKEVVVCAVRMTRAARAAAAQEAVAKGKK